VAVGAGLAAASLAALLVLRAQPPAPSVPPVVSGGDTAGEQSVAWAADLLYADGEDADELADDEESLPAEYAAIAGVLLDR
jgi:hypothetical protein